jgi:site-specific recombinase XerD
MNSSIIRRTKFKWFVKTGELYDGNPPYIDWHTLLRPNDGTKSQRTFLLASTKEFVDAITSRRKTATLAHGTVLNWYFDVRRLVQWMTDRDKWRFSSLTAGDIAAYLKDLKIRKDGKGEVSALTVAKRVALLNDMWNLRHLYAGALRFDPATIFPPQGPASLASSTWRALDESIAMPLLRDAIVWLQETGDFVERTLNDSWTFDSKLVGLTTSQKKKKKTEFYASLERNEHIALLRTKLAMPTQLTYTVLSEAVALTKGACAIVIFFLVGLRISEFIRLDSDALHPETDSLGNKVYHLHGIAAKQGGRPRTWVACAEVASAVGHLQRSTREARRSAGPKALWLNCPRKRLVAPGFRLSRVRPQVVSKCMKRFARAGFRAAEPPVKRLHPHVARKTFARFVILRNKTALGSLAHHYGHVRREITDGYYVGNDIELAKMLAEEGRRDLAEGLAHLLESSAVAGRAGEMIAAAKASMPRFRGRAGLMRIVNKLIDEGVQLAPCDWGFCVYSQALSACGGDERGPNEARRSPDICSGCSNFAVTERHRVWWEVRLRRDDDFLSRKGVTEQSIRWVERRRSNSARILSGLVHSNQASATSRRDPDEEQESPA